MRPALVVAMMIGCGAPTPPATPPAPASVPCARTAEHMVDALAEGLDPRPPDEQLSALIAYIRGRCEEDGWAAEARRCLADMRSAAEADRCGTLLTAAQQARLTERYPRPAPGPK